METGKGKDIFSVASLRSDLKMRAMKGASATVLSQGVAFLVQLLGTILLARMLAPVDFGLVAMVTTFSLILSNFGTNGLTESVIQRDDLNHGQASTLFWLNIAAGIFLAVVFAASAPLIARFYNDDRLVPITVGISFSIVFNAFSVMHLALLKRKMRFLASSGIAAAAKGISLVASIALAWYGMGYWALVGGNLVLPLATAIGAWIYCEWRPGFQVRSREVASMIRYSIQVYGNFMVNYFSRNTDNLLVGWRFGADQMGFYKKAYDLFFLPACQITAPLTGVAVSVLSKVRDDRDQVRKYFLDSLSLIAFIGMALSVVLTVNAKELVLLLLGPKWETSGEIFRYFGAGIGIMLVYTTHGWLHLTLGTPGLWVRWGIVEFVVMILFFIGGLTYGPSGVAIAYVTSYYLLVGPAIRYAGKPIGLYHGIRVSCRLEIPGCGDILRDIMRVFVSHPGQGLWHTINPRSHWCLNHQIIDQHSVLCRRNRHIVQQLETNNEVCIHLQGDGFIQENKRTCRITLPYRHLNPQNSKQTVNRMRITKKSSISSTYPGIATNVFSGLLSLEKFVSVYYHMVSDDEVPHTKHLISHKNIKQFESDMDYIASRYDMIDLIQLYERILSGKPFKKSTALLTFDDGYKEMYEIVIPILLKKGIPGVFFLNSAFIDNMEMCYLNKKSILLEHIGTIDGKKYLIDRWKLQSETKEITGNNIVDIIKAVDYNNKHMLDDMSAVFDCNLKEYLDCNKPYLTSAQINYMIRRGFNIGAHSVDHPLYSKISFEDQIHQTSESVRFIKEKFDVKCNSFAFPHTDKNVSVKFFNHIYEHNLVDISFGTAGMIPDLSPRHVQRCRMERASLTAETLLSMQMGKKFGRKLMCKDSIARK